MQRKPNRLRALEAKPGHRPLRDHPKPPPVAPACPTWLPAEAKRAWRATVPELERIGLIGRLDVGILSAYCLNFARWREAEKLMTEEGLVVSGHRNAPRKHPAAQLARDYQTAMLAAARQLGLTPAARQSLDYVTNEPEEGDDLFPA